MPAGQQVEKGHQRGQQDGDAPCAQRGRPRYLGLQEAGAVQQQQGDGGGQHREQPAPVEVERAVVQAQRRVEAKRQALHHQTDGGAEDQGRYQAPRHQRPLPPAAPQRVGQLAAVVKTDRAQKEAEQQHHHGDIEHREGGGIDQRPGCEQGAGTGDEPHLIALPHRPHAVDHQPPVVVILRDHWQQHGDAEIEAIHHDKADHHEEQQRPPDEFQGCVIHQAILASSGCSPL